MAAVPRPRNRTEIVTSVLGRSSYAIATAAIVCAGLLCRSPALGLPWLIAKYAGSALWGAMVYSILRTLVPRASISASATIASPVALSVELLRLYRQPALDAFRATLAGKLLLGSVFSPWDMVAYAFGIGCAILVDAGYRSKQAMQC